MKRKPKETDFSDANKERHGVEPWNAEKEIKALKARHRAEKQNYVERIATLEACINEARSALESGRRGDAMMVLKRALPARKSAAPQPPQEPQRA